MHQPILQTAARPTYVPPYVHRAKLGEIHYDFAVVVLGSVVFDGGAAAALGLQGLLLNLAALYFCFNVCLYGGTNALAAAQGLERNAPRGGVNPQPIGPCYAILFAILLWAVAFTASNVMFGSKFNGIFVAYILLNESSSKGFGNIKFARFLVSALAAPVRLFLGALVTDSVVPPKCFVLAYLLMMGVQFAKVRAIHGARGPASEMSRLESTLMAFTVSCIATTFPSNKLYLGCIALGNVVFLVLPRFSPSLAAALFGEPQSAR